MHFDRVGTLTSGIRSWSCGLQGWSCAAAERHSQVLRRGQLVLCVCLRICIPGEGTQKPQCAAPFPLCRFHMAMHSISRVGTSRAALSSPTGMT